MSGAEILDLEEALCSLAEKGCWPCISYRGKKWRAHINGAGNWWAEGSTPSIAVRKAARAWRKAGFPMDGYAEGQS